MAKTEVAVQEEGKLSFVGFEAFKSKGEGIQGLESLDRSDFKIANYRLLQPTSEEVTKNKKEAGTFINSMTGETKHTIDAILLCLGKGRQKWKKPFKRGEKAECYSFDSIVKYDGTVKCATCPHQDWNNIPEGSNHPACSQQYIWLAVENSAAPGVSIQELEPFKINAAGASISPTKNFLNKIVRQGYPTFIYKIEISSKQETNESGTFYTISYAEKGVIKPENFQAFSELELTLKDMFLKSVAIDIEDAVVDAVVVEEDTVIDVKSQAF